MALLYVIFFIVGPSLQNQQNVDRTCRPFVTATTASEFTEENKFYVFQLFHKYCAGIGMRLLTIKNETELEWIVEEMNRLKIDQDLWSSYTRMMHPTEFTSLANGQRLSANDKLWAPKEPVIESFKKCTILNHDTSWYLSAVECSEFHYTICENKIV